MTFNTLQAWINNTFFWLLPVIIILAYLLYRGTRSVLARGAYAIAFKTETIYDDLFVDQLQPFRFAWLAPLLLFYYLAEYFALQYTLVISITIILIIWFLVDLLLAILSGINDAYRHNPRYQGVSVAGYIGIIKVLVVVGAIVLTISYFFEVEPVVLLGGLGAWLAVLLLIFRDTILSFLASIQISTQQIIKEGDEVDIPAFGATGLITNIDLQSITVQNYDNTETVIPTSKIVEVGFKNFRRMLESGNRRIKTALLIDTNTIQIVDHNFLESLQEIELINKYFDGSSGNEKVLLTNIDYFIEYAKQYLNERKDVRQQRFPFLIRLLDPTSRGTPLEFYLFVKANNFIKYEEIKTEIFIHLLAIMPYFGLKIFQEIYRED
jgi:miniconductance mechanosensitive channel